MEERKLNKEDGKMEGRRHKKKDARRKTEEGTQMREDIRRKTQKEDKKQKTDGRRNAEE